MTLADRTVAALRAVHEQTSATVHQLTDEQLLLRSGSEGWEVAQVLSHLGSGAEITLAGLEAVLAGQPLPGPEQNQAVWDRWDARGPREQAQGFLVQDARVVEAFEALTPDQHEGLTAQPAFLPFPLPLAAFAGLRLGESALHAWDVLVALDPEAALTEGAAEVLLEHYLGDLGWLVGFTGRAEGLGGRTAAVELRTPDAVLGLEVGERVALVPSVDAPTGVVTGTAEAVVRLLSGRLRTGTDVTVTGDVTLQDLRAVFPGY